MVKSKMKYLLSLCLLAFLPFTAMAQVGEYRTDLAIGGSAGYVMSNVGFVPDVPQGLLPGYTAGLTVRYTCEKYFSSICSILGEVNVIQTGWKEDMNERLLMCRFHFWHDWDGDVSARACRLLSKQVHR